MKGHTIPEDTTLRGDLSLSADALNKRYERQWAEFEKTRWWPWYEQWGPEFFAPRAKTRQAPNDPTLEPEGMACL